MAETDPKDARPGARATQGGSPEVDALVPAGEVSQSARTAGNIHAYIGTRLREVYDDVAKQPIPDRFLELMRQLDAK